MRFSALVLLLAASTTLAAPVTLTAQQLEPLDTGAPTASPRTVFFAPAPAPAPALPFLAPGVEDAPVINPWTVHRRIAAWGLVASWAATAAGSLMMRDDFHGTTIIPVAGPWVTIALINERSDAEFLPAGREMLITSGVVQAGFLAYLVGSALREAAHGAAPVVRQSGSSLEIGLSHAIGW